MSVTNYSQNALSQNLWDSDPELYNIIKKEKLRQKQGLEMIASENFTSVPVLQCLSSCLHNKYSEGLPGQRYYGGNKYIDEVEILCQKRALELFDLDSEKWAKMIIAGISCYSRCLDYKKFRQICDDNDCYLFSDMAHVSGLVAAKAIPSPFEFSDVVSTTTHKTLRGPRAGIIFYRKGVKSVKKNGEKVMYDLEQKINQAVFPGLQGGPHNNTIGAIATALKLATLPEFVNNQHQVITNAKHLCSLMQKLGYKIVTDGTDVHLVLVDLRNKEITGAIAEFVLEEINIACNKNTVPGDVSALNPSGIRLGTPALTTRGMKEKDMEKVVDFIHKGLEIAKKGQKISGPKLIDFKKFIASDALIMKEIENLKFEVAQFANDFPLPGLENL
ncbi:serine hydroxymethyltransferase, cytosolic, putative [Pediculus humanus corporis]|uniref:Serine hydroxymethyltransferase n=1 Tax=Pediculus humanus subsp. corporis TaxID=121224 RepID=E0W2G3_PEDHC|nr:serine hydroxymethyltransferase, cytosolic, putative [Pediculus humanus corporis]EEB19819.1 serine hydroxymethyltransferase, cytosolic, putative [Pediculus humanus corporis]